MKIVKCVAGAVVLLLCGTVTGLLANDSLERLLAQSDAVVVGTIVSGTYSDSETVFDLRVARSLKGTFNEGEVLSVSWKYRAEVPGNFSLAGRHGLFFLSGGGTEWSAVPVDRGHLSFDGAYYPLSKVSTTLATSETWIGGDTVIEKIASELSASIDQCERGSDKEAVLTGKGLMELQDRDLQRRVMEKLSARECPGSKAFAEALALKLGEPGAVDRVATQIQDIARTPYIQFVWKLLFACRSTNPDDVQALGRLATATTDYGAVRTIATYALVEIHNSQTVPILAALLSSSDEGARMLAVRGLSRFVENTPMSTPRHMIGARQRPATGTPYRTPETDKFSASHLPNPKHAASYVEFWKKWWESVKGEFGN